MKLNFKSIFCLIILFFLLLFTKSKSLSLENTPIDLVYKYIDLHDKNLEREGLPKLTRDYDNCELKYSLRSVIKNLPWIRKIFIIMPNEKVKFLKEYNKINDKIIYIKDKDFLGFDSESSICFEFNFYKLKDFGCSENFIYLNDDYFIGKPLKKSDFFYEDKEKIYPYVIYKLPVDYNQYDKINDYYNYLKKIRPSRYFQYNRISSMMLCYKILGKNIRMPSKSLTHFPHNASGYNLKDLKEIYDSIEQNYEFADDCLNAKTRTRNALQYQTFYSFYLLNKYDRKITNKISYLYTDIAKSWNANYDCDLFCINYSGNTKLDLIKSKIKMESLFPTRTKYEIPDLPDGTYCILNKLDENKCLDIDKAKKSDNANLQLYQNNNTDAQKFEIKYDKNGFYKITAKCSNKNLNLEDENTKMNVSQHESNDQDNQKWYIVPTEGEYFYIISKNNLLAMSVDVPAKNGSNINCQEIKDTDAQKFKFIEKL